MYRIEDLITIFLSSSTILYQVFDMCVGTAGISISYTKIVIQLGSIVFERNYIAFFVRVNNEKRLTEIII